MRIYAHTDHVLRGYTGLTHEAIIFRKDQAYTVSDAIGQALTGAHPYSFCKMDVERPQDHFCKMRPPPTPPEEREPVYAHEAMTEPPVHREMVAAKRGRGRPRK